jgi:hypothetical protein
LKGFTSLTVKPSKCLYCYPNANAFSFHHPDIDEFICRYVIGKDEKGYSEFIVEECRNGPLKFEDVFPGI